VSVFVCIRLFFDNIDFFESDAMGTRGVGTGGKCILTVFGKRNTAAGGPTYRVSALTCFPSLDPRLTHWHARFSIQQGACPMKNEENKEHPFTAATSYSPMVQRLHFMFGNLSRVDARLNTEDRKPYCNWFCRDAEYILRAGRLPLYGANYFPLLYAILKGWAVVGKTFLEITSEDQVDELMQQTSPM